MTLSDPPDIAPEDRARAEVYSYLSLMLAAPPDAALLARTAALTGDDETALGRAIARISADAARIDVAQAEREFNKLFIGMAHGELLPYASHYITGFLNDKPLANLRGDMARLAISRAPNVFEPEDNIASVLEMMAGQIMGRYGASAPVAAQQRLFDAHLRPWAGDFFDDLAESPTARLYAGVGVLGRDFMAIEREAFDLL